MAGFTVSGVEGISVQRLFWLALVAASIFSSLTSALNYVTGSECESVCSDDVAGTIHQTVACLDNEYGVAPGIHLKECVTCQLNSTAVDPTTKVTDVEWALCEQHPPTFGREERVSISSPCQVSCTPLKQAITFHIPNSTNSTDADFSGDLGFCTGGQFDDFTINNCAFCYSFIPQQLILGNFLQALHIACHSPPAVGKSFYPDGVAIFNQSTIAGPTGPSTPAAKVGLTGIKLILAIVVPLLAGIFVLLALAFCCWHFTSRRRGMMAASGRMSKFHDGQIQDYSPVTPRTSPPQAYAWNEPPTEMQSISVVPKMADPPVIQAPTPRNHTNINAGRFTQHTRDESSTPLTNSDRNSYVNGDDLHAVAGEVKNPRLHEQYIGSQPRGNFPAEAFRAQDGFAKEQTQGGWT